MAIYRPETYRWMNYVEVTPAVLAADAYDANDVIFDTTLVPNASYGVDKPVMLQSIGILDEDDEAAATWVFWFLKTSQTFGTADSAPSISDANARDILGYYSMASASVLDVTGAKFGYATNLGIVCQPASGTRNIYIAATSGGTPTFTNTTDVKIRLGFVA